MESQHEGVISYTMDTAIMLMHVSIAPSFDLLYSDGLFYNTNTVFSYPRIVERLFGDLSVSYASAQSSTLI